MATLEAQVGAIELARLDRDREMKAFREVIKDIDQSLKLLLADKNNRDGALGLGRWLFAVGLPALIGGWALAIWHLMVEK